jgi:uncharacterized membrane protein YedE/YeeE
VTGGAWFALSGLLFSTGLALSGMTRPDKVSGFLDFAGRWDPSLMWVMAGAVAVFFAAERLSRRLRRPLFGERFPASPGQRADRRLLLGAALFGVGWGLSGLCPGPALVSVGAGASVALWFVPAMVAGMLLHDWLVGSSGDGCSGDE